MIIGLMCDGTSALYGCAAPDTYYTTFIYVLTTAKIYFWYNRSLGRNIITWIYHDSYLGKLKQLMWAGGWGREAPCVPLNVFKNVSQTSRVPFNVVRGVTLTATSFQRSQVSLIPSIEAGFSPYIPLDIIITTTPFFFSMHIALRVGGWRRVK